VKPVKVNLENISASSPAAEDCSGYVPQKVDGSALRRHVLR